MSNFISPILHILCILPLWCAAGLSFSLSIAQKNLWYDWELWRSNSWTSWKQMFSSPFVWPRMLSINQIGLELFGFRVNTCLNEWNYWNLQNISLINDSRLFFSFFTTERNTKKIKQKFIHSLCVVPTIISLHYFGL